MNLRECVYLHPLASACRSYQRVRRITEASYTPDDLRTDAFLSALRSRPSVVLEVPSGHRRCRAGLSLDMAIRGTNSRARYLQPPYQTRDHLRRGVHSRTRVGPVPCPARAVAGRRPTAGIDDRGVVVVDGDVMECRCEERKDQQAQPEGTNGTCALRRVLYAMGDTVRASAGIDHPWRKRSCSQGFQESSKSGTTCRL
jgi:hypothetical protein